AYWKVRDALKLAKDKRFLSFARGIHKDTLTGVPKYFYDLDSTLNTKTKSSSSFENIVNSLEREIGGEFIFKEGNLSFKDNQTGKQISKNLISFGMTNLGMIQALLKHNVITAGSFVFIDEPETNLHPEWQVILMNVLLELASKEVNIVITTHSTDILKALEVNIKKQKISSMENFLSVHFLGSEGELLEFESDNPHEQLIEARNLLNSAYETLYFSDL
ncbi:MAG: ATP-binding protein, partial [Methylococcales bacterium]|nr:ATP-binding protein [Methylococcales bacterium]